VGTTSRRGSAELSRRRSTTIALGSLLAFAAGPRVAEIAAQACRPARTALVLSGGGAKGLAHLGVLGALDSLGVRPDLIVGTSMGAVIGALYASGYRAREIDSLARDLPLTEIIRPFRIRAPHPWDQRIPLLFMVRGRSGFALQTGVVDETLPNARLNVAMLRGNLLARGRFDRLPIPFLAVATDLRDRRPVVLADGDLARAVRASSALPLVFPPVTVGAAVLIDGGLSANIPIAQARLAGAERVIVSDVTEGPTTTLDVESPLALADQLIGFLFQQPPAQLTPEDLYVRPGVQSFRSLDFSSESAAELLALGRRAADSTLGRARCLPARATARPGPLPSILSGWRLAAGTGADSTLVARLLRLAPGSRLDPGELAEGLNALGDAERFRGSGSTPPARATRSASRSSRFGRQASWEEAASAMTRSSAARSGAGCSIARSWGPPSRRAYWSRWVSSGGSCSGRLCGTSTPAGPA
jgi:NTE family protein